MKLKAFSYEFMTSRKPITLALALTVEMEISRFD
jgi:hypothetical protein